MSIAVGTHTDIRVRTAVHLTDAIIGTFENILAHLGLSSSYLTSNWTTIEKGLKTWIAESSLKEVSLECGDLDDPEAVFDVPLSYTMTGSGDIEFVTSQARLTRALAKLSTVPAGTKYRIVVSHHGTHTPVDGWEKTTAADTSGLSSYRLGSVASGPGASASIIYRGR